MQPLSITFYFLFVSFKHIGDYNQALETSKVLENKKIQYVLYDVQSQKESISTNDNLKYVFHSVGEKGMYFLQKWKSFNVDSKENILFIIQIHQSFKQIQIIKPNYLIIPQATYQQTQITKQINVKFLNGPIFQKISQQKLKQLFYQSIISKQLNLKGKYIIIMLSGDAPNQTNIQYFNKQSVDDLIVSIQKMLLFENNKFSQYKIIVQNGPRTGKHDPYTGQQIGLHSYKSQENPQVAIDKISQYFISQIIKRKWCFNFYNFAFQYTNQGERIIHSYYKPLLYLSRLNDNIFIFPMESVSMSFELPYYINKEKIYAYFTSSTNQNHMKFVQYCFQKGLYNKFDSITHEIIINQKERQSNFDEFKQVMQEILKQINLI